MYIGSYSLGFVNAPIGLIVSFAFLGFMLYRHVKIGIVLNATALLLGFLTGSPIGGVAISSSILPGILTLSPKTAAVLYMSAYLGYLITPTHLCLIFTADYFKSSLGKVYKYLVPSVIVSFSAVILTYLLT